MTSGYLVHGVEFKSNCKSQGGDILGRKCGITKMCVLIVKFKLGLCTNQGGLARLTSPKRWVGHFWQFKKLKKGTRDNLTRINVGISTAFGIVFGGISSIGWSLSTFCYMVKSTNILVLEFMSCIQTDGRDNREHFYDV